MKIKMLSLIGIVLSGNLAQASLNNNDRCGNQYPAPCEIRMSALDAEGKQTGSVIFWITDVNYLVKTAYTSMPYFPADAANAAQTRLAQLQKIGVCVKY